MLGKIFVNPVDAASLNRNPESDGSTYKLTGSLSISDFVITKSPFRGALLHCAAGKPRKSSLRTSLMSEFVNPTWKEEFEEL